MLSRTDLVTWVLGAVAKPIETRVPKLLAKEQCDPSSSAWQYCMYEVHGTLTCPPTPCDSFLLRVYTMLSCMLTCFT